MRQKEEKKDREEKTRSRIGTSTTDTMMMKNEVLSRIDRENAVCCGATRRGQDQERGEEDEYRGAPRGFRGARRRGSTCVAEANPGPQFVRGS